MVLQASPEPLQVMPLQQGWPANAPHSWQVPFTVLQVVPLWVQVLFAQQDWFAAPQA